MDDLIKIYTMLVRAKTPYDVFGSPLILEKVVVRYKSLVSIIHPDHNRDSLPLAEEATKILNAFYKEAADLCVKPSKSTGIVTVAPKHKDVAVKPTPTGVAKPKSMVDKVTDFFNDPRVKKTNAFLSNWNDRLVAREEANNGSIFGGRMFEDVVERVTQEPKRKKRKRRDEDERDYRGDHL